MKWFPDWSNDLAIVMGSGPSVKKEFVPMIQASGAKVIVVNSSVFLYPWADVLYATDISWWYKYDGVPTFKGLKVTANKARTHFADLKHVNVPPTSDSRRPNMIFEPKGLIGSGGNSGFQALNLCVQFGARRIILVGFDMRIDFGTHWHGDHPSGLRNPEAALIDKWRAALDKQAPVLERAGVRVVNASPYSALTAFPKFTLEEALSHENPCADTRRPLGRDRALTEESVYDVHPDRPVDA